MAHTYLRDGRDDDAIGVLRGAFRASPGAASAEPLLEAARTIGRQDEEAAWIEDVAQQLAEAPYGDGAVLVDLALAAGDLDGAWQVAQRHGAGHQWERLAAALAPTRPAAAAILHRREVERDLTAGADSKRYPRIARRLALIRRLHEAAGLMDEFDDDLRAIRAEYGRRPSLMKALDREGLVPPTAE